ncbi:uncharacterized protein LOC105189485 [Harpegnathos saltator]|uniref:uncharacterized protein LOC105189485 n=1 Tax=Harpegnathos saltator TaxID=610380 RepID=UPI000DBED250|nr:uncharacterized protein LOC105189485 [Harpegnathos saltator]
MDDESLMRCDRYKCKYCNYFLPKENFIVTNHSCFADIDMTKENIFVDDASVIFRASTENYVENDSTGKKCVKNKQDKLWSAYDEVLIETVRARPCLWNVTIPVKERGPLSVKEAWLEINFELEEKFDVENIKKRWRNLRDCYIKAKKKTAYTPSGSAAPISDKKRDGFRFIDQMQFLNDSIISRPSVSNVSKESELVSDNVNTDCSSTMQEPVENENSIAQSQMFKEDNIRENGSQVGTNVSHRSNVSSHNEKRRKTQSSDAEFKRDLMKILSETTACPDDTEGFLIHLGDILRKLPYKDSRLLQTKIMKYAIEAGENAGLFNN